MTNMQGKRNIAREHEEEIGKASFEITARILKFRCADEFNLVECMHFDIYHPALHGM